MKLTRRVFSIFLAVAFLIGGGGGGVFPSFDLPVAAASSPAPQQVFVADIPGLSNDFIMGGDIGSYLALEKAGVRFHNKDCVPMCSRDGTDCDSGCTHDCLDNAGCDIYLTCAQDDDCIAKACNPALKVHRCRPDMRCEAPGHCEADFFDTLAAAGMNYARIRVFNDPVYRGETHALGAAEIRPGRGYSPFPGTGVINNPDLAAALGVSPGTRTPALASGDIGKSYGGGNNDLATAIAMGKRATEAGMRVLVCFHMSDFWADPGGQRAPKAWSGFNQAQRQTAIHNWTYDSIEAMLQAGVDVGMVQIGNETNSSMSGQNGNNMHDMMAYGIAAVVRHNRKSGADVDQSHPLYIRSAIHLANPNQTSNNLHPNFAAALQPRIAAFNTANPLGMNTDGTIGGATTALTGDNRIDYDVWMTSYYEIWHGTQANLTGVLTRMSADERWNPVGANTNNARIRKEAIIVETSYPYNEIHGGDGFEKIVPSVASPAGYPASVQGQANSIRDLIALVHNLNTATAPAAGTTGGRTGLGTGFFYWEPAWMPVNQHLLDPGDLPRAYTKGELADTGEHGNWIAAAGGTNNANWIWEPNAKWIQNLPLWEATGAGWATRASAHYLRGSNADEGLHWGGNGKDNQALFDFWGFPLASLEVFNLVRGGSAVPLAADAPVSSVISILQGGSLPANREFILNNNTRQSLAVTWNSGDVTAAVTGGIGTYNVRGTVTVGSAEQTFTFRLTIEAANLLQNASFETNNPAPAANWSSVGGSGGAFTNENGATSRHPQGGSRFIAWGANINGRALQQTISNVSPGYYTLSLWTMGDTNITTDLSVSGPTVNLETAARTQTQTANSGWGANNYMQRHMHNILVEATGNVTVSIAVTAPAWGTIDLAHFGQMNPNDVTRIAAPPLAYTGNNNIEYASNQLIDSVVMTAVSNAGMSDTEIPTGAIQYEIVSGTSIKDEPGPLGRFFIDGLGATTIRATKPGGNLFAGSASVEATFTVVEEVILEVEEILSPTVFERPRFFDKTAIDLPATISVKYNNNTNENNLPIEWNQTDIDAIRPEAVLDFPVRGTVEVDGRPQVLNFTVRVTPQQSLPPGENLVLNPSFELGTGGTGGSGTAITGTNANIVTNWTVAPGGSGANLRFRRHGDANARTGVQYIDWWSSANSNRTLTQTLSNVPAGNYTLSVWVQVTGNPTTFTLSATGSTVQGPASATWSGLSGYRQLAVETVTVSATGNVTININLQAGADSWAAFDDVAFSLHPLLPFCNTCQQNGCVCCQDCWYLPQNCACCGQCDSYPCVCCGTCNKVPCVCDLISIPYIHASDIRVLDKLHNGDNRAVVEFTLSEASGFKPEDLGERVGAQFNTSTMLRNTIIPNSGSPAKLTARGTATFSDSSVGDGKTVTITDIVLGGTERHKYYLESTTATATGNIKLNTAVTDNPIHIQRIEGLRQDFIMGVDISSEPSIRAATNSTAPGVTDNIQFRDRNGVVRCIYETLADHGVNYVRARIWNDPYSNVFVPNNPTYGHGYGPGGYGAGNSDVDKAIEMGLRAADNGMKLLANFHFSDFWADPARYNTPKAWLGRTSAQKAQHVYDFTYASLERMILAGVDVGMVQIGNEKNPGMAGVPIGPDMYRMVARGCDAVDAINEKYGTNILKAVHFTDPHAIDAQMARAQALEDAGANYDVFLLSWYPYLHRTVEEFTETLTAIAETFGVYVGCAEVSYSTVSGGYGNFYAYNQDVQGQANAVTDAIRAVASVPDGKGIAAFYWEPAWPSTSNAANQFYGTGWRSQYVAGYGDTYTYSGNTNADSSRDDSQMFARSGNRTPLASLDVWRLVHSGAIGTAPVTPVAVGRWRLNSTQVTSIVVNASTGFPLTDFMPDTIEVIYSNNLRIQEPVEWNTAQFAAADNGPSATYTVQGTVTYSHLGGGTRTFNASVDKRIPNLLTDPGFEAFSSVNPTWTVTGGTLNLGDLGNEQTATNARNGNQSVHFGDGMFGRTVSQTVYIPAAGYYTLTAFLQSDNTATNLGSFIFNVEGVNVGSPRTAIANGSGNWGNFTEHGLRGVYISAPGPVTVSFTTARRAVNGIWGALDDAYFGMMDNDLALTLMQARALDPAAYTDASWAALLTRRNEAEAILQGANPTPANMTAARNNLINAMTALIACDCPSAGTRTAVASNHQRLRNPRWTLDLNRLFPEYDPATITQLVFNVTRSTGSANLEAVNTLAGAMTFNGVSRNFRTGTGAPANSAGVTGSRAANDAFSVTVNLAAAGITNLTSTNAAVVFNSGPANLYVAANAEGNTSLLTVTATFNLGPVCEGCVCTNHQAAPAAPAVSSVIAPTVNTITLTPIPGAEFRIVSVNGAPDVRAWQTGYTFAGLNHSTDYVFEARMARVSDTQLVSAPSLPSEAIRTATPTYTVTLTPGDGYILTPHGGSVSPVIHNGSFSFTLELLPSHDQSTPNVFVNGVPLAPSGGVYTIDNITVDRTITVTGVAINTYTITFDGGGADGGSMGPETVNHGEPFIIPSLGFTRSGNWNFSAWEADKTGDANAFYGDGYTIGNVIGDITLTARWYDTSISRHLVTLVPGTGYYLNAQDLLNVQEGDNFRFTLGLYPSHDQSTPVVKANGITLTAAGGIYTINSVAEPQTVTVEDVVYNEYTVTLTPGTGYSLAAYGGDTSPVTHGGSFRFTLGIDAGYNQSIPVVKANGYSISPVAGVYTINSVAAAQTVTVENVGLNTYTVTGLSGTGYEVLPEFGYSPAAVTHGNDFKFTVELGASYSNSQITVTAGGPELIPDGGGVYTIPSVTSHVVIQVQGIVTNTYAVTLTPGDGYTLAAHGGDTSPVTYSGSFRFTLGIDAAYDQSTPTVKVNGYYIFPADGVYTISNITAVQTVTVENVARNTYTVTFAGNGHHEGTMLDGVLTHGFSYQIPANAFTRNDNHSFASWRATDSQGALINYFYGEGVIPLQYITGNITLTAQWKDNNLIYHTIQLNTVGSGYELTAVDPYDVEDGNDFRFKVVLEPAYSQSSYTIYLDGYPVTLEAAGGVYTIPNVAASKTVTVSGVTLNEYAVILTPGTGYTLAAYGGDTSPVIHGGSFRFTLVLHEDYDEETLTVMVNGFPITTDEEYYTISGITAAQTVTVNVLPYPSTPGPWPTPTPTPTPPPETDTVLGGSEENPIEIPVTYNEDDESLTLLLDDDILDELIKYALATAGEDEEPEIIIDMSGREDATSAAFNVYAARAFSEAEVTVKLGLPNATAKLGPETLTLLGAAHEDGTTLITVEAILVPQRDLRGMQAAQVKGWETVVSLDVFVGEEKIDVPLTVSLPYDLKPNEDPRGVRVWYLCGEGTLTCMDGVFNEETGLVTFTIEKQSYFFVVYDPVLLWVNVFTDIADGQWYYGAVAFANYYGLFNGYGDGLFGPRDSITRAQFAQVLFNREGQPALKGSGMFTDVAADAWFHDAVQWAAENGIVQGVGRNRFAPDRPITRQEMAVMLYRYAELKGYDIPENRPLPVFTDLDQIDAWAESAAKALSEAGVINGSKELFNPLGDATRGEAAQMFMNFMRFVAED